MAFKVYAACLAAYNNGKLHGQWLDLDDYSDADDLQEAINEMLAKSPEPDAEEWAFHDYDYYNSPDLRFGEYENMETLIAANEAINEHGEALALYKAHVGGDDWTDLDGFEEAYCGCHKSELDYAEELFDELYAHEIPESIRFYIDYEAFSRDLFINDYFSEDGEEGTHIFRHI